MKRWLVEDIPDTAPDETTSEIINSILGAAVDLKVEVERIKPFHWKYLRRQVKAPDLIHSREAAEMGMVWLDRIRSQE